MHSMAFGQIVDRIKSLPLLEQKGLLEWLNDLLRSQPPLAEEQFKLSLLKDGLLSEIHPRVIDSTDYDGYQPVPLLGQPLSEMVIEDR